MGKLPRLKANFRPLLEPHLWPLKWSHKVVIVNCVTALEIS